MTTPCPIPTTERPASMSEKMDRMVKVALIAIGLLVSGVLLLLIPVIGWVTGPMFLIAGVLAFFLSPVAIFLPLRSLEGLCPYCGHSIVVAKEEKAMTCKVCRSRVIVHPGYFCPVGVQPSAEKLE